MAWVMAKGEADAKTAVNHKKETVVRIAGRRFLINLGVIWCDVVCDV